MLNSPEKYAHWKENVKQMADRMIEMRALLKEKLLIHDSGANWDHLTNQIGMFCYTGLSKEAAMHLRENSHIYIMSDGRINVCGINSHNADYVAKAFAEAKNATKK